MNRDQKAQVVDAIATQISESEAVFAVDYRGISVPQAAELREKLTEAGARFRVVKNTLTIRAAEQAGADELKEMLEGPTAFTFVTADGDVALAAKALAQFRREHEILEPKGGRMGGEPITIEQIAELGRLPAREVLHGQLVGVIASPITGLVRGLNQMIAGFAQQLQQLVDQGLVGGDAEAAPAEEAEPPAEDSPAEEAPAEEQPAEEAPAEEAPAAEAEEQPPADEGAPAEEQPAADEPAAEEEPANEPEGEADAEPAEADEPAADQEADADEKEGQ